MIALDQKHAAAVREHGERDYPFECCGLLIGKFFGNGCKLVAQIYPISNARAEEHKRNRFLIRPLELLRGEQYSHTGRFHSRV